MCPKEDTMRLCAAQKEMLLIPMDTCFFRTLEDRASQIVLHESAERVFLNGDSSG